MGLVLKVAAFRDKLGSWEVSPGSSSVPGTWLWLIDMRLLSRIIFLFENIDTASEKVLFTYR